MDFNFDMNEFDEEGKSGFTDLRETGVSDVVIKRVGWSKANSGAIQLNITVNAGGEYDDTFYQGNIKNKDGGEGFEVKRLLNPLSFVCGVKALTTSKVIIDTAGGTKEVDIFDQFGPVTIKIAHQKTWSDYKSKWEKKIVKVFFEDGRTATESKEGKPADQINWFLSDKFKDKGPKGSNSKAKEVKPEVTFDDDDFDVS